MCSRPAVIETATPKDRHEPRPVALALGGLVALAAAMGIGRFVYTPILPRMTQDLGMTKSAAGLLASANFAGYLTGALLAATPALRGARRRWLLLGVAVTVAAGLIPDHIETGGGQPSPAAPGSRRLTAFAAAYGLFGFGYVITATFLVVIIRGSPAVRSLEALVWVVVGIAAVPSVALW